VHLPLILSLALVAQSSNLKEQRLTELRGFAQRLTAIVLDQRVEDLVSVLDYEITVALDAELSTAALTRDLRSKGANYCRVFDTPCGRARYGPQFLSVADMLKRERQNLRTDIRFFKDLTEDLEFAYIEYSWGRSAQEYGWKAGVFVEMERLSTGWKIRALFPLDY
jgi:hypothetical protein